MWERPPSATPAPVAARRLVPVAALFFAVVAVAVDPGQWWETGLLAVPVILFTLWVRWPAVLPVLGIVGPVAVALACSSGRLEASLFLVSLLAFVAAAWEERRWVALTVVALCLLTPIAAAVLAPVEEDIMWPVWLLGIGFPAMIGVMVRRLEGLTAELASARRELAERAVIDERQRIGRDVHDLVGHGLAAVMLHVTGARHVLRRDPAAADDALRTAEAVGRQSMNELRRTVELLRSNTTAVPEPPASLRQIRELVRTYSAGGLHLDYTEIGDLEAPSPAAALAAYRIVQQALANAAQHAAADETAVRLEVVADALILDIDSVGATRTAPPPGSGHGVASMRERARVAGGELRAGPTAAGWSVHCRLPIDEEAPR